MPLIPAKNGRACWPCIAGGLSIVAVIVGVAWLAIDYLLGTAL